MNVRDDCLDDAHCYERPEVYQPIARLHANNYIDADHHFELKPHETVAPAPAPLKPSNECRQAP